ncbi:hypothetical protein ACSLVK_01800 [Photorhabdus tasmaniensis]|uniref:hypothetical protein n=1 Tax=Photorhabdus TaxID=29487 RepID=UPI0036DC8C0E
MERNIQPGFCIVQQYTKFGTRTGFSIAGGSAGAYAAGSVCLALGIATAPAGGAGGWICAAVGGVIGGYAGGELGDTIGEYVSDIIISE